MTSADLKGRHRFSLAGLLVRGIYFWTEIITDLIRRQDGLSGIFWLFLNRGQYGASWKKMILTAINLVIVAIGGCLVSLS